VSVQAPEHYQAAVEVDIPGQRILNVAHQDGVCITTGVPNGTGDAGVVEISNAHCDCWAAAGSARKSKKTKTKTPACWAGPCAPSTRSVWGGTET